MILANPMLAIHVAAFAGSLLLIAVMCFRGYHLQFPVFWTYLVTAAVRDVFMWGTYWLHVRWATYALMFYVYWISEAALTCMVFLVIWRVFMGLFGAWQQLRRLGQRLFLFAVPALLIIAIVAAHNVPGSEASRMMAGIVSLDRSVAVVMTGLLLLLLAFSASMRLPWRTPLLGIALGLGILASFDLLEMAMRAYVGPGANHDVYVLHGFAAAISTLIWLFYFARPGRTSPVGDVPSRADLDEWNLAVKRILRK